MGRDFEKIECYFTCCASRRADRSMSDSPAAVEDVSTVERPGTDRPGADRPASDSPAAVVDIPVAEGPVADMSP